MKNHTKMETVTNHKNHFKTDTLEIIDKMLKRRMVMTRIFRLQSVLIFLILIIGVMGCGGSKETVDYTPPPDPFPQPDEEEFNRRREAERDLFEPVNEEPADNTPRVDPFVLNTVYFEFDQSKLTEETRTTLAQNARLMLQYKDAIIRIEGHCDERGTVEYNLALGERRALAVRDYLSNFGVPEGRVTVISYGKERPADPGHNSTAWARNRRAEFVILSGGN